MPTLAKDPPSRSSGIDLLKAIENDLFVGDQVDLVGLADQVKRKVARWVKRNRPPNIPKKSHAAVDLASLINLISDRVTEMKESGAFATYSAKADADEKQAAYLNVQRWTGIVAHLCPETGYVHGHPEVLEAAELFIKKHRGEIATAFGSEPNALDNFARTTRVSSISKYAGELAVIYLMQEYMEWRADHQFFDEDHFPATVLRELTEDVLAIKGFGQTFIQECQRVAANAEELRDLGTFEWYERHGLLKVVAEIADQSKYFCSGLRPTSTEQAICLVSKQSAARVVVNDVFFTYGHDENKDHRIAFKELLDLIEDNVTDKAAFAQGIEDAMTVMRLTEGEVDIAAILRKDFLAIEDKLQRSITRNGVTLKHILDKFEEDFPEYTFQNRTLNLLSSIYSPCLGQVDHDRHTTIVRYVRTDLNLASERVNKVHDYDFQGEGPATITWGIVADQR